MKFTDKFFKSKNNALTKQAENLVSAANIFVVSSFVTTLDRFPILSKVDPKQWDSDGILAFEDCKSFLIKA